MNEDSPQAGRPPKSADQMRSRISRISSANVDRHEQARQEAVSAVMADRMRRKRHALVVRFRRLALRGSGEDLLRAAAVDEPWGITVQELHGRLSESKLKVCRHCGYSLEGLMALGRCPECGRRYKTGEIEMAGLCAAIADVLEMTPGSVRPEHQMDELVRASCLRSLQ